MKKIKIHSILSNSDNETTIVDEEVMFDEVDNVITYMEDDLKVSISIFETFVKMRRCNEDYDLNLEFDFIVLANNCLLWFKLRYFGILVSTFPEIIFIAGFILI